MILSMPFSEVLRQPVIAGRPAAILLAPLSMQVLGERELRLEIQVPIVPVAPVPP
jgi:hypothetical protein